MVRGIVSVRNLDCLVTFFIVALADRGSDGKVADEGFIDTALIRQAHLWSDCESEFGPVFANPQNRFSKITVNSSGRRQRRFR